MSQVRALRKEFDPQDCCTYWQQIERCVIDIILKHVNGSFSTGISSSRKRRATEPIDLSDEPPSLHHLPQCQIPFEDLKRLHPDIVSYILNRLCMKKIIKRPDSEALFQKYNQGTITLVSEHLRDIEGPTILRRDFIAKNFSKHTISELLNYRNLLRKRIQSDAELVAKKEPETSFTAPPAQTPPAVVPTSTSTAIVPSNSALFSTPAPLPGRINHT